MSTKVTLKQRLADMTLVEKSIESLHNLTDTVLIGTDLLVRSAHKADEIISRDWELPSRKVK